MIIDISKAVEFQQYDFHFETELEADVFGSRNISLKSPFQINGWYIVTDNSVGVSANISAELRCDCDCCLEELIYPMNLDFSLSFTKDGAEDTYPYTDFDLDITNAIFENVTLNLPGKFICKTNCKGLCPKCGVNRNHTDCLCHTIGKSSPFDVLKSLAGGENNGSTKA